MQVEINARTEAFLKEATAAGRYRSEQEVLDEAVALLRKRDELRADIQAGIDQADRGELIPADEVFARLQKRAQEIEAAAKK